MADITRRVTKKLGEYLAAGETVEVALLVEPRGTYGIAGVGIAVARRAATSGLDRRAERDRDDAGEADAASFPAQSCAVVVTSQRVLASPSNGIRFKPPVEFPRAGLRLIGEEGKGLGKRLTLGFADGSTVVVDAQRGQPFGAFASALAATPDH